MYSVAKNASPESRPGEAFLAVLLIFENKFFADTESLNKSRRRD